MDIAFCIGESHSLAGGGNLKHAEVTQHIGLSYITGVRVHEVHHMHLAALRHHNAGREHARVHAYICRAGRERDRRHRCHLLDIENVEKGIQHVILPLAKRVAACNDEIVLSIHVID